MKNLKRGFTLIELLVVIAIIGILSSVVLASLNTARNKGKDTAVKSNLANARAEAEMFYDTGSTYTGVCANDSTANIIGDSVLAAAKAVGLISYSINGTLTTGVAVCNTNGNAWAAAVPLKNPIFPNIGYCVDSTGGAKEVASLAGTFVCL